MADKAISELVAAPSVTPDSLFVLQQDGTAKKLTAQVLENWLLSFAGGHGGIQSYELLKTVGLVKTYRFTLADQTPIDIEVVDGRGVESVKPTATNGLVVTYTITYNDGKTDTITVTNGAKGDKGDRADIWVKYASQKPTASSHSFGDVADAWIGIATGHNMAAAPTDWQKYTWFQWKGEKGDTGAPATLIFSEVTYQTGDSGTILPSGSWSKNIPFVPSGKYLWIRKVLQFNSGDPITSYSVSRFGIDGSGSVSTVAGVAPDANGNVPLTAENVGAVSLNYAQNNFAPSGYGLGENLSSKNSLANANTATTSGWYKIDQNTQNGIGAPATLRVDAYASTYMVQTAFAISSSDIQRRQCIDGIWGVWEYVNPPMEMGVEYRTTERWNGYPVYAKLVDCKALPNNSAKSITAFSNTAGGRIISAEGIENASGQRIPTNAFASNTSQIVALPFSGLNLTVLTNFDGSAYTQCWITVKYVKY